MRRAKTSHSARMGSVFARMKSASRIVACLHASHHPIVLLAQNLLHCIFCKSGVETRCVGLFRRVIAMPGRPMYDGRDPDLFGHFAAVAQRLGVYTVEDDA